MIPVSQVGSGHSARVTSRGEVAVCVGGQLGRRRGRGQEGGPPRPGPISPCLRAVLPGAIYICTEDAFPDKRLQQLMALQHLRTDVPGKVIRTIKFGDQIFVEHAADVVSVLPLQPRR